VRPPNLWNEVARIAAVACTYWDQMSRGPGHIQRRLLELFEKDPGAYRTAFSLATALYQVKPDDDGVLLVTDAQLSAVGSALASLSRQGKIRRDGFRSDGRQEWTLSDGAPDRLSLRRLILMQQWPNSGRGAARRVLCWKK
jgi:hypothetical protein